MKYLQILAKEVFSHPGDESGSRAGANSDVTQTEAVSTTGRRSLRGNKGTVDFTAQHKHLYRYVMQKMVSDGLGGCVS